MIPVLFEDLKHRIAFRDVVEGDLPVLLVTLNDSWQFRHHWRLNNIEDQLRWFKEMSTNPLNCNVIAIDMDVGDAVGLYRLTSIDLTRGFANSAIDIFKDKRGRGLGRRVLYTGGEYAKEKGLKTLWLEVLEHNAASLVIHTGRGLKVLGVRRDAVRIGSRFINSVVIEWRLYE